MFLLSFFCLSLVLLSFVLHLLVWVLYGFFVWFSGGFASGFYARFSYGSQGFSWDSLALARVFQGFSSSTQILTMRKGKCSPFFYFPFCDSCVVAFFVSLLILVLVVVRVVGGVSLLLLLLLLLWWKTIRSLHFALKCVYFV